jgi:ADP-heptose:LPS heptosyltransferase
VSLGGSSWPLGEESTVLLRKSSLGDVILVGSVSAVLPGHVTLVTDTRWFGIASRLRGVDEVVAWPETAHGVPSGRVVDLHGSLRSRWLLRGRKADRLRKHSIRRRLRLLTSRIGNRPTVPVVYGRACGITPAGPPWIDVPRAPDGTLVLVPGAAWATKRWSAERFGSLGRGWTGPVVVLGGPGELALCEQIAGYCGGRVLVESGFDQSVSLMERASVVVSGDSGLMHLAGACGVPVVALFGPTAPSDGFFVYSGDTVEVPVGCRPCSLAGDHACPVGHHRCMDLDVDVVLETVCRVGRS